VQRGKPDPEVFTLAARRLRTEPGGCVVIEDAPAGVQAAQAAGMRCIALLSRGRARSDFDQAAPHVFVQSLRELSPARIERFLAGE
jgi:beta-phosphoglucomutase-like phosphatase (HAD superfamily)